ncbi:unnamed protein product [Spirodela intermedia]|uniref:C2H2-type domain-containing protein n=1 Tax=Spirodela intermedia TaxID=51605 RepID=A0A7I8KMH5_SPIIN|nr:unnamed protein product [Spirodela intermedia]
MDSVLSEPAALCFLQNQHGLISPPALLHGEEEPCGTLLSSISILRDKVDQLGSIAGFVVSHKGVDQESAAAMAVAGAGSVVKEIILTASSMMFSLQQIALGAGGYRDKLFADEPGKLSPAASEIVELDAADLLAKYTHHCHVCGKGFKRDANLRMHMRAHGEEYKTRAALASPAGAGGGSMRKYSCPQEGCRWNMKHPKFQPLKSMVCVKNHYRRSHCPKMYICNRCNRKKFAVVSDLRTHEKHCNRLRWRCSCGTSFSRKDKLVGHLALFPDHAAGGGCSSGQVSPPEIRVEVTRNACWN